MGRVVPHVGFVQGVASVALAASLGGVGSVVCIFVAGIGTGVFDTVIISAEQPAFLSVILSGACVVARYVDDTVPVAVVAA